MLERDKGVRIYSCICLHRSCNGRRKRRRKGGVGTGVVVSVGAIVSRAVENLNVGDVERRGWGWLEVVAMMVVMVLR
jgi:hypothetical protein